MVVRVCERAAAGGAASVTVATDDARIAAAVREHGYRAELTDAAHASGTDRIAEAAARMGLAEDEVVVNLQGDEPLAPTGLLGRVAGALETFPEASMATACHGQQDESEMANPNVVKVVLDARSFALYFSRARIPYVREASAPPQVSCYRHVGLYAYRVSFLKRFTRLSRSPLERAESLEQLRALWHGHRIAVVVHPGAVPAGVDTPQDLDAARKMFC
jgi:3-deoxy-manno-octulosonate cytidylyltransferase (CMP-KDO synthetase)